MPDLFVIIAVVTVLSQIFLQFSLVTYLFDHKVRWWITLPYSVVPSVLFFDNPFVMLAIFCLSAVFFYCFIAKMHVKTVILATAMHLFLSALTGNIGAFIYFGLLPTVNPHLIRPASSVVIAILLWAAWKFKVSFANLTRDKTIFMISSSMIIVALAAYMHHSYHFHNEELIKSIWVPNILSMLFMQFAVIYVTFILKNLTIEIERHEFHRVYTDTLEQLLDNLRGFKHNQYNIIHALLTWSEQKEYDKLRKYLEGLADNIKHDINLTIMNAELKDTMPLIYMPALLTNTFCDTGNIRFEVVVTAKTFDVKTVSDVLLGRMVGNLLSNAYEAAKAAENTEKKKVTLTISNFGRARVRIVVTNSVDAKVDTSQILSRGYSTKEGHTGFGLYEVKAIADRQVRAGFDVVLNIDCTEDTFTAELLV